MDRILIHDLLVRCIIGVTPEERREKQDVIINLVLFADLGLAGRTDRVEDTIDYRMVKKEVYQTVEASSYSLLEALAEGIAQVCLAHAAIAQVEVTVEKLSALRFARSVGISITRSRGAQA